MDTGVTYCMALCTSPSEAHALELARGLVDHRLAACVQVLPIRSVYRWEGKREEEEERLILAKTRVDLFDRLVEFVSKGHPYQVPEIVRLDIAGGLDAYLSWVGESTG